LTVAAWPPPFRDPRTASTIVLVGQPIVMDNPAWRRTTMHRNHAFVLASVSVGLLVAARAEAGSYQKVNQSDWWAGVTGLPSYVNMYIFLPTTTATKPPIVVVPHHCQGSASSSHSESASIESAADKNGFIIIYPEATGQNCWDAGSSRSLKHGGGGDTGAIVQMVKYTLSKYSGDADRVYTMGGSSGGIMTEALLGVYPDVFMAGISFMGVPCGCWAEQYNDVTGSGNTAQWSGPCAGGSVSKTAQQWGDLVRSYFPGYTGHRPRLQHWHGTADTTLNYKNMAEDIKEWTNVLGLSESPTGTENNTPKSGTTHQFWKNSCYTVYETFSVSGAGHSVGADGNAAVAYFGLDKAGGEDPETAVCPGAVPGGTAGAGGSTGSGGTTGAGGAGGAGDAGSGGRDAGREAGTPGSGGAQGGSSGGGGRTGGGGSSGTGGAAASGGSSAMSDGGAGARGGASGTGGAVGDGGNSSAKGGAAGSGGASGTGGSVSSGGASGRGGSEGSGGAQASGGANGQGGASGTGGEVVGPGETSSTGCSCAVGGRAGHVASTMAVLLLAGFGLILHRQRRARR
jgi:acetylxylan esterase